MVTNPIKCLNYNTLIEFNNSVAQLVAISDVRGHGVMFLRKEVFPTDVPYLMFLSYTDYINYFGEDDEYAPMVSKYFSTTIKTVGGAPGYLFVANWFRVPQAARVVGIQFLLPASSFTSGEFVATFDGEVKQIEVVFTSPKSYDSMAQNIQDGLRRVHYNFANAILTKADGSTSSVNLTGATTMDTILTSLQGGVGNPPYTYNTIDFCETASVPLYRVDVTGATTWDTLSTKVKNLLPPQVESTAFLYATVIWNPIKKRFEITSGSSGIGSEIELSEIVLEGEFLHKLGLLGNGVTFYKGANSESLVGAYQRVKNSCYLGYAYFNFFNDLVDQDYYDLTQWVQTYKQDTLLVHNFIDRNKAEAITEELNNRSYTAFSSVWDEFGDGLSIHLLGTCAAADLSQYSIDINRTYPVGFKSSTHLGSVGEAQAGETNEALVEELDRYKIQYCYNIGDGINNTILFGKGLMNGEYPAIDIHLFARYIKKMSEIRLGNNLIQSLKFGANDPDMILTATTLLTSVFMDGKNSKNIVARSLTQDEISLITQINPTQSKTHIANLSSQGFSIIYLRTENNIPMFQSLYLKNQGAVSMVVQNIIF
jgi:hypothetical protein